MKIKNEKELLDLFIDKENIREWMQQPIYESEDKHVWATEGHILIRIDEDKLEHKYAEATVDSYIVHQAFAKQNIYHSIEIPVAKLEKALAECEQEAVMKWKSEGDVCPECEGDGTVETEYHCETNGEVYYMEVTCPICDGRGRIDTEVDTGKRKPCGTLCLRGIYFGAELVETMVKACHHLGITEVRWNRQDPCGANVFSLGDGIDVLIMSRQCDKNINVEV